MYSYKQACEKLGRMKDSSLRPSRKIDNHTYLKVRENDVIAVLLHSTDVLKFYPDGTVVYNSGGWLTVTTKDRMNKFGPLNVWSDRGVWYVSDRQSWSQEDYAGARDRGVRHTFADGLAYRPETGEFKHTGPDQKETVKLRKRVAKYAKDFMAAFDKGDVPEPGPGDCFFCYMREVKTNKPLGEVMQGDHGHILSHMEESYFVSSLLVNAMEAFGASAAEKWTVQSKWNGEENPFGYSAEDHLLKHIEKYVKRYCYRQLGLAA